MGAAAHLGAYKYDVQPPDAARARQLHAHRVQGIKRGPKQGQEAKLLLANAALDATLNDLAKEDQALYLFEGRREAINMTVTDPDIRARAWRTPRAPCRRASLGLKR